MIMVRSSPGVIPYLIACCFLYGSGGTRLFFRIGHTGNFDIMNRYCRAYGAMPANPDEREKEQYLYTQELRPVYLGGVFYDGEFTGYQNSDIVLSWAPASEPSNGTSGCVIVNSEQLLEIVWCNRHYSMVCAIEEELLTENHAPEQIEPPGDYIAASDRDYDEP
ncbi:unnamed protein product [Dicrocoelium dendriticum]|nr:unnamed protein product [Dicrocoelium dendriticum]